MSCPNGTSTSCPSVSVACPDAFNCNGRVDFTIKRHDTKPPFKVRVEDCDGPMDLTDLVLEISMWSEAKLKKAITTSDTYISLADGIGFEQCQVGDIVVMGRIRAPEQMLITGFDETNKFVQVQRGYNGSLTANYKKGSDLRIFRVLNAIGSTEMDKEDIQQIDGTITTNVLVESRLVYEWSGQDTCLPGCYYLEFKLLKMTDGVSMSLAATVTPSFISYTADQMGCSIGTGVDWVRRYPSNAKGYAVRVFDTGTAENVL